MNEAVRVFEEAIEWLHYNYHACRFFTERDVVWTLQRHLSEQMQARTLPYRVFNDFPILPGTRRSLCTDIAILNSRNDIEVAAEFKYEPAHDRTDIWPSKFLPTVVFWGDDGVGKDVKRVQEFVQQGAAGVAHAIFIDEDSAFRSRTPHAGSAWVDWTVGGAGSRHVSVLWACAQASS
jgi:hypothetical protein